MSDYMSMSLAELRDAFIEDGVIDADEVQKIRARVYADGVVDKAEAEFVFQVNDAVSGRANDPAWSELFVQVICDYLLKDEVSPGTVDTDEATWLLEQIQKDGQLDQVERALLEALKAKSESLPEKLKTFLESH